MAAVDNEDVISIFFLYSMSVKYIMKTFTPNRPSLTTVRWLGGKSNPNPYERFPHVVHLFRGGRFRRQLRVNGKVYITDAYSPRPCNKS
jgi:hypothetical protein